MKTVYHVYRVSATPETHEVEWPNAPSFKTIDALIRPLLDDNYLEHVSVLHNGKRVDMFVDEEGRVKGLPRNEAATAIYRNNWLTQHPGTDPESLAFIVGTAVLFDRIVWT